MPLKFPRIWSNGVRAVCVALIVAFVAACGGDDGPRLPYNERPVEDLYNDALDELRNGIYRVAAIKFDEVERQHPYSAWARRAMLMSAYSHYLDQQYDLAILSAERFLALHPGNAGAPYALYLVSICYYERISDVGRDQKMTRLALQKMNELARRFPDTEYARDARLKIDLARDHLAGKEMAIGRYYLKRGDYIAAINRFRTVVSDFEITTHVPEALHRLVETYLTLGIVGEARTAAAVLGFNHRDSAWYADSYALLREANLSPELLDESWMRSLVTPRIPVETGPEILRGEGPDIVPFNEDGEPLPLPRKREDGESILFAPDTQAPAPAREVAPPSSPAMQEQFTPQSERKTPEVRQPRVPAPPSEKAERARKSRAADPQPKRDAFDVLFGDPKNRRPIAPPPNEPLSRDDLDGDTRRAIGAPTGSVETEPLEEPGADQ